MTRNKICNYASYALVSFAIALFVFVLSGCENKDPSLLKVYVRTATNELAPNAEVVIIGDVSSNPPTMSYVDTLYTNASGFALFALDDYFTAAGADNNVAYFDVLVKKGASQGTEYVRCRIHLTAVKTVFLN